ncbi:apolipoprotein N-acyltransferase [Aliiroseovarius sp.]|uniref:apolipoprotein N-acyltransferase n=1 Tax=Aliiroseovarius sp. TaxID=1872442 RepID=UPI002607787A|nr:apolipoprotein N-acyltransferase [Aliiroseovarius sp.]
MARWPKPERGALWSGLAGAGAALGQAPFGLWPATVLGLALGAWLVRRAGTWPVAAGRGWALGAGFFAVTLIWIVQPFLVDPWRHGWMAPFAILLMAGGLALFWGAASGLAWRVDRQALPLAWPIFMGLAELLRGRLFTGFPWGEPGGIWIDTPLAQGAAYVGAAGLTFLTFVLVAALTTGRLAAGLALSGLALAWLAGGMRAGPVGETDVRLRLVQPNAAQHLKWDPEYAPRFVARQLELSAAPADRPPDLVIWPETALPYLLRNAEPVLRQAAAAAQAPVVLGIQRAEAGRYYNSMAVIDAGGNLKDVYDKAHLVPFGEYIPGGNLLAQIGITAFASQRGYGYSPGPGARVLDLGAAGKALPLICYEAIFARDLRAAPERAGWVLQITNDAWFGTFSGPQQHLAQARMRAIEMGLPVVRAANTGISAVIDPLGRVTSSLGLGQQGYLDATLPRALPETVFARFGNLALVVMLAGGGLGLLARRRRIAVDAGSRRM